MADEIMMNEGIEEAAEAVTDVVVENNINAAQIGLLGLSGVLVIGGLVLLGTKVVKPGIAKAKAKIEELKEDKANKKAEADRSKYTDVNPIEDDE